MSPTSAPPPTSAPHTVISWSKRGPNQCCTSYHLDIFMCVVSQLEVLILTHPSVWNHSSFHSVTLLVSHSHGVTWHWQSWVDWSFGSLLAVVGGTVNIFLCYANQPTRFLWYAAQWVKWHRRDWYKNVNMLQQNDDGVILRATQIRKDWIWTEWVRRNWKD
jgi:hypothetical protein